MNVLDLFSGIGGFSLGLERAGMRTVAFCEIDPYCRRVLAKHWPSVPCYDDVRSLTAERLAADGITAEVICGGFPCQDISSAGAKIGIEGEKSGLWSEYARIIGELRPRFVIVENVSALLSRGLDRVLGDLAALGFDAEWHCIPAAAVGAPHLRDRLWLVAYPNRDGQPGLALDAEMGRLSQALANADREPFFGPAIAWPERDPWAIEPDVARVADGIPSRMDRVSKLGNAVVPQIPEIIGRAIMSSIISNHEGPAAK
jgi:DNA (cytosine-5)-methyltransferase 1